MENMNKCGKREEVKSSWAIAIVRDGEMSVASKVLALSDRGVIWVPMRWIEWKQKVQGANKCVHGGKSQGNWCWCVEFVSSMVEKGWKEGT